MGVSLSGHEGILIISRTQLCTTCPICSLGLPSVPMLPKLSRHSLPPGFWEGPRRVFLGCQRVGMPGLGSRLSTYCPTKRCKWWCSQHTSADQTPIPCVPVASPGLKPKGRVCMWWVGAPALSNWASLTWGPRCANYPRNVTNEMTTIRGQLNWWCRLNPPRLNSDASTSK